MLEKWRKSIHLSFFFILLVKFVLSLIFFYFLFFNYHGCDLIMFFSD